MFMVSLEIRGCVYTGNRRPTKVTTSCCTSVSNTHIKFRLQGYHIQNAMPPCVDAITNFHRSNVRLQGRGEGPGVVVSGKLPLPQCQQNQGDDRGLQETAE
uniref:Chemokine interleukin-8-like domain-containing protein n=1 Tax=Salmo trutta TaxID=8032 RepID=A0A674CTT3_SALTR